LVRVKICGITDKRNLTVAVDAGAEAVGFVVNVPLSPRNLTLTKAAKLIDSVPIFCESVVVTVPENLKDINQICDRIHPSAIQVHGNRVDLSKIHESMTKTRIIRSVSVDSRDSIDVAVKESKYADAIHLDSSAGNLLGGTGKVHDWVISRVIREAIHPKLLVLAGGLTPENVGEAMRTVKPYAVDVSSGVESKPGVKDPEKVYEFVRRAKEL